MTRTDAEIIVERGFGRFTQYATVWEMVEALVERQIVIKAARKKPANKPRRPARKHRK